MPPLTKPTGSAARQQQAIGTIPFLTTSNVNQSIKSISLYSIKILKVIRVRNALMSNQLKAVLNRYVFSSALKLVKDEANQVRC